MVAQFLVFPTGAIILFFDPLVRFPCLKVFGEVEGRSAQGYRSHVRLFLSLCSQKRQDKGTSTA